ncbi:long-chain fatty acid transport protein 1 [Folsomia candida]|uniref:long-chain-fatty-acid--CoA ligase n=1 Tax=Folsomia candida TaxID=158441 RepID=A0A226EHB7_FOLCA|nr:long-chain fatty acid transport protein 1 [Folsomia candida]XP_035705762.1 long-chain fatty acid transport protein 1 [Folsomia candida]OXA56839.1 Long-chain fatty acid transport protein 1 [Folsomia candida]
MGILWFVVICILSLIIWGLLLYPRQTYISLVTLPRDAFGMYKYATTMLFSLYCKRNNMTASKYFDMVVTKKRMQTCFMYEDEVWTFKRVQEESLKIAKYFKNAGYKKGDVVGLFMESRPEYVCIWLGLGRLGVATSLLNYNLRLDSLSHCIKISNVKGLIFGTELTGAIQELVDSGNNNDLHLYSMEDRSPPKKRLTQSHVNLTQELNLIDKTDLDKEYFGQVNNNDVAFYIFTSGTTGLAKAAKMKYSRLFTFGAVVQPLCLNPAKDILLTAIPLYHVQGGILGVTCALFHGVPQVIIRKFSASNFWKQCIKYDATYCQYLGEIMRYLYNQPEKPEDRMHKVKVLYGNGANPAIWEKFVKRFGVKIIEMYGSTEGNCSIMNLEGHIGAVGYLPNLLYSVLPVFLGRVDHTTGEMVRDSTTGRIQHVEHGEAGELLGKIVMSNPFREFEGYTDEQATRKKIVDSVRRKGDRWFRTGDILMRDEFGYFYFKDRTGDTFKWKGENVSTAEVEQVIAKASGYKGVAVYGVEVPGTDGKCGMATVSDPSGKLDIGKLSDTVLNYLPPYARPVFMRICGKDLEMTGTFKLLKVQLQKEGFDPNIVTDALYILQKEGYIAFNHILYKGIIEGSVRV